MADFNITSFFGRFHPVLVHLPIGILLLAFIFQLLSFSNQFRKLKSAVRPSLFFGMVSALFAAGSGYYLSLEGGYDKALLEQHKWMGFATAALSLIIFLLTRKYAFIPKRNRKKAIEILFFPLVILLIWTGHLGGSITHGEEFLFETPGLASTDSTASSMRLPISNVEEAEVFKDIIHPLLKEKCFACHSSKKQKGQLRLDAIELIVKGGKHGEIVVAGDPKESEIFKRITLSEEEKNHMPPKKETQLTSTEIELIRWWIREGATFDKKVNEFIHRDELMVYLKTQDGHAAKSWIPEKVVAAPDQAVMSELQTAGVMVVQVSENSNYLSVSFAGKKEIDSRVIELLNRLSQQVIDLNLSWTSISDKDLANISSLNELRVLNLSHTAITTLGIVELSKLSNLYKLNLVETNVTDEALKTIGEMNALKELYIFNTKITKEGISMLNTKIKIDTGRYQLPSLSSDTIVFSRK